MLPPDGITVRGTGGTLAVGYQVAADLGAWSVTTWPVPGDEVRRCRVEADVVRTDPFWITDPGPFALTLARGNWVWRWPSVPPPVDGKLTVVDLPPPERR